MAPPRTRAELVLHPVRIRIVQAIAGRRITAQQLQALLPDVPPATLYRQIGALQRGGVLRVAEERRVRGAMERIYTLAEDGARPTPAELAAAGPEAHRRYFSVFVASLLDDFARYLQGGEIDVIRDGVAYRKAVLYLSDEEYARFAEDFQALLAAAQAKQPAPGRRRRFFTRIVVPGDEPSAPSPVHADLSNDAPDTAARDGGSQP